ncbi:unnamed protein product [Lactuca virosa]|uniref:RING-type domain-containing protein n=1 Tax=Lactuca virosa TaxID=75947 RepID=A0AAU9LR09_9ASTR|nr:unnamed protein product [Lactuca virosa]
MVLFLFRFIHIFNLFQPHHHHDHQKLSGSSPVSAVVTREFLVVRNFKDIDERKDLQESCAVCLNEFEGDDKLRCLINCTHDFHQGCLDRWMDHVQDHSAAPSNFSGDTFKPQTAYILVIF